MPGGPPVVFDTTMLALLLDPEAKGPRDSEGAPVTRCRDRIDHLITRFAAEQIVAVIPTPVIAELLVRAGAVGPAWLELVRQSARFRILPFDLIAAIELAQMTRLAIEGGDKKDGSTETWAKVRFDRQIMAIAKVAGASTIYSDDGNLRAFAIRNGLKVIGVGELPLPPEDDQPSFLSVLDDDR